MKRYLGLGLLSLVVSLMLPIMSEGAADPVKLDFYADSMTSRNGQLWSAYMGRAGEEIPKTIRQYDPNTGKLLSELPRPWEEHATIGSGLGYDSHEGVFLVGRYFGVTELPGRIYVINQFTGKVLRNLAIDGNPGGIAYDDYRRQYWVTDFRRDRVLLVDKFTGRTLHSCPVLGTRIFGLAYDQERDALFYNGRDQFMTYGMSAQDCRPLVSVATPGIKKWNGGGAIAILGDSLFITNIDDAVTYRIPLP